MSFHVLSAAWTSLSAMVHHCTRCPGSVTLTCQDMSSCVLLRSWPFPMIWGYFTNKSNGFGLYKPSHTFWDCTLSRQICSHVDISRHSQLTDMFSLSKCGADLLWLHQLFTGMKSWSFIFHRYERKWLLHFWCDCCALREIYKCVVAVCSNHQHISSLSWWHPCSVCIRK